MTTMEDEGVTVSPKTRALLAELADFLAAMPPGRFDYGRWVGMDWQGNPDLSCGTTACAIGWATTLPSWQETGLVLMDDSDTEFVRGGAVPVHEPSGRTCMDGIAAALDIPRAHACFLFAPLEQLEFPNGERRLSPGKSATPKVVAEHIREYLELVR